MFLAGPPSPADRCHFTQSLPRPRLAPAPHPRDGQINRYQSLALAWAFPTISRALLNVCGQDFIIDWLAGPAWQHVEHRRQTVDRLVGELAELLEASNSRVVRATVQQQWDRLSLGKAGSS